MTESTEAGERDAGPGRSPPRPARPRPLPVVLRVVAAAAAVLFALPLVGLLVRTPWGEVVGRLGRREVVDALLLSLETSVVAAGVTFVLGLPLAAWLAHGGGGGERGAGAAVRTVVRVLVTLPMVLPPVVAGVALLLAFGRGGFVGGVLDEWFGAALPFTTAGVVVAEAYVAMPFFVLTVEAALRGLDHRYADAAATLGGRPWFVFRTVTLPMVAPAVRAGLLVAWARALGEFGATITFAGNLDAVSRTMPLAVYTALETDPDAAIVLSLVLVVVSAGVLFALRRRWFPLGDAHTGGGGR